MDPSTYVNTSSQAVFRCSNGHIVEQIVNDALSGHGCKQCVHLISRGEQEIADYVRSLGVEVVQSDRSVIAPQELDIWIPSHRLAIEFNGLYYHSEERRGRTYHADKTRACMSVGVRLLQIYEDEWSFPHAQGITKRHIAHLLGRSPRGIGARKCSVCSLSAAEASEFLSVHHIQGAGAGSVRLGLRDADGRLRAVMLLQDHGKEWVLTRYAADGVVGGFSKLLARAPRPILTFADLRYSYGDLYEQHGFARAGELPPDYYWCKGPDRRNKRQFRHANAHRVLENYDPALTEDQNATAHGWHKVWDCGKLRYVYAVVT